MTKEQLKSNGTYLIIGAGPVGLGMAKALKDAKMSYDQVDGSDDLGGNWHHGTYASAHILSSRKAMEYPDFPMPDEYPDFPSSAQMFAYYQNYADTFDLRKGIQFNTKVEAVHPIQENEWSVRFENGDEKKYTGVLVCNGHHWSKRYPDYEGEFKGESMHSKDYIGADQVKDKRVLVIGAGNSAFDIVSECARSSAKTFISIRRGIWIFPKTFMGKPLSTLQVPKLPEWIQEPLVKAMLKVTIGSHKEYGLPKPKGKVFDRHPTVNTDALMHIKHGRIKVKGGVSSLSEHSVNFEDGSSEDLDLIVYCTGFNTSFPFLPKELDRVKDAHVEVYGFSMYEDYKGLYLIGWMQPRGGVGSLIGPYSEMLTSMIQMQEKVETPIGAVLKDLGEPLPTTHIFGGGVLIKWINKMNRRMGKIQKRGLKMDQKNGAHQNKILTPEQSPRKQDTRVTVKV